MEKLLTMQQVKERFQVKDNRTIQSFMRRGLKFMKLGIEYRFDIADVKEFEEKLKQESQEKIEEIHPVKQKRRFKTVDVDYEKRKINLTQLKVV